MREFKELVVKELSKKFANAYVTVKEVCKNNGIILHGVVIHEENNNVSPTIYLDNFYLEYISGKKSVYQIADEIESLYKENRGVLQLNANDLLNYEKIKDSIFYTVVNQEKNKGLLEKAPHVSFLDLAIVFRVLVLNEDKDISSFIVHDFHMERWNITPEDLLKQAIINTPKLFPAEIHSFAEIIADVLPAGFEIPEMDNSFYILTNIKMINGAGCILYSEVLEKFADKMNADIYILPSSIHECLLIPASSDFGNMEPEKLKEMVQSVNGSTCIDDTDILSDSVYYYSRETKQLTLCK